MIATDERRGAWLSRLASGGGNGRGPLPPWFEAQRRAARSRFETLGLPTVRDEAWKDTNLAALVDTPFVPASPRTRPGELPPLAHVEPEAARIVVVDGRFAPELSSPDGLPAGVWVGGLRHALETIPQRLEAPLSHSPVEAMPALRALATALADDGAVLIVPDGVRVERPVHLVHLATGGDGPTASHSRTVVVAGKASRMVVVESFVGPPDRIYWINGVADVLLGEAASLDHYRVQQEGPQAFHISALDVIQERDSRYRSLCLDFGGRLVRHDLTNVLGGEGATALLEALYVLDDAQHVDHHTTLDHARPNGSSREVYKGVLAGRSRAVFHGRIVVRPGAQKTDAKQSNPNLLLSDAALAHTRPQLEIHADDVKCTHGATIGRLDDEAVFYLRSRAIPAAQARTLLVQAFADEILERIELDGLRGHAQGELAQRLAALEVGS